MIKGKMWAFVDEGLKKEMVGLRERQWGRLKSGS